MTSTKSAVKRDLLTDFTQFPEPDLHTDVSHWIKRVGSVDAVLPDDEGDTRLMAFNEYCAGALSGMAGVVVGHPFDTMKIQMQIRTVGEHNVSKLSEAWNCIKSQGLKKGIFRGMMFPFLSYGAVNSLLFGVYSSSIYFLVPDITVKPSNFQVYIAGCIAGSAQMVISCPVEVVKCTLQAQIPLIKPSSLLHERPAVIRHYYNGPVECVRGISEREGVRGFYKGFLTMFIRDVPSFGLYILVYEWLHHYMLHNKFSDTSGIIAAIVSGGIAGCLSWTSVMPFDVIKTRLQVDHSMRYRGFLDCLYNTVKNGGFSVLYRGMAVTLLRAFPVNAITFLVYSQVLEKLNEVNPPNRKK